MESLHVLPIPLEEAKTNGLDRTLSARCPHAELKPPPVTGRNRSVGRAKLGLLPQTYTGKVVPGQTCASWSVS